MIQVGVFACQSWFLGVRGSACIRAAIGAEGSEGPRMTDLAAPLPRSGGKRQKVWAAVKKYGVASKGSCHVFTTHISRQQDSTQFMDGHRAILATWFQC